MPNPFPLAALAAAQAAVSAQAPVEDMENGRCPVTGQTIPQEPEFFVVVTLDGKLRRYAVCCAHCVKELKRHPAKYLHTDGRPKNEKA